MTVALLVGLVSGVVNGHLAIVGNGAIQVVTEFGPSFFAERVEIVDAADEHNGFVFSYNFSERHSLDLGGLVVDKVFVRRDGPKVVTVYRRRETVWRPVNYGRNMLDTRFIGRSDAIVFQLIQNVPWVLACESDIFISRQIIFVWHPYDPCVLDEHICSKLPFSGLVGSCRQIAHGLGGLFLTFDGSQGSAIQPISGNPQAAGYEHQENRGEGGDAREYNAQMVIRRFCFAGLSLFGCLGLSLRGWGYLYDERFLLGAAWLIASLLVGCLGMGLWVATAIPATWGWLI